MLEAAESAIRMVTGRDRADLDENEMLRLAVVKAIETVGEAAYKCSEATTSTRADIPRAVIRRMRHRLVHDDFDVNLDVVWKTVQVDLPVLVNQLRVAMGSHLSP